MLASSKNSTVEGILAFAERILPRASDLWVQASLDYKQRLQQLFFPEGIAFDGNRFNRTAATDPRLESFMGRAFHRSDQRCVQAVRLSKDFATCAGRHSFLNSLWSRLGVDRFEEQGGGCSVDRKRRDANRLGDQLLVEEKALHHPSLVVLER